MSPGSAVDARGIRFPVTMAGRKSETLCWVSQGYNTYIRWEFYEELSRDRLRKCIQVDHFICCSLSFSAHAVRRDFTINRSPQYRTFTRALQTEMLNPPLFPGPVGVRASNDWCISVALQQPYRIFGYLTSVFTDTC